LLRNHRIKLAGFNHRPFLRTTRRKETRVLEYNSPAAQASRSNCPEMPGFNLRTQYIQKKIRCSNTMITKSRPKGRRLKPGFPGQVF
jgi:hypothetical protein